MKSRAMATMGAGVDSARVVGDASNPSSSSTATYRSARASTSRSSARSASANARASSSGSSAGGDGRAATALRWARALAAASALWAGVSVAKYVRENGVPDISPQRVHEAIDSAGVLGVVVYVAGFALAELLHLPALVFITAGILKWGKLTGWILSLVMAPLSCGFSFIVVRRIGGQALEKVQWKLVKRAMFHLKEKPVKTLVAIRSVLFLSPSINYALALSSISLRDFMIGSAIGLVTPLTLIVLLIDHLINFYGWNRAAAAA